MSDDTNTAAGYGFVAEQAMRYIAGLRAKAWVKVAYKEKWVRASDISEVWVDDCTNATFIRKTDGTVFRVDVTPEEVMGA